MDIIVMGFRGVGKTLYSVALGCALSRRYELPILSNIGVNYPGSERLRSIEHFAEATGRVVIFDEAHRNLDARQWKDNKQFTDTLLYNRKRMKHVIYTTPHVRNLDVRIRDIVPILVVVDKVPGSDGIRASWFDVERAGGLDGNLKPFRVDRIPDKTLYYGLYDTSEEAPILPGSAQTMPIPAVGLLTAPDRAAPGRAAKATPNTQPESSGRLNRPLRSRTM